MKKTICILSLILAAHTSYAAYLHDNGDHFYDQNSDVYFPCTGGGTPLVIYSTPVANSFPISSKDPVNPVYVENGYNAPPLSIDSISQIGQASNSDLVIGNYNPATGAIHFSLSRNDNKKFYVNSVNFASIDGTASSHYVSSYNVTTNGSTYSETIVPLPMYPQDQDTGMLVESLVKNVEGTQYTWNQAGAWRSYNNSQLYPISYHFSPQPIESSKQHFNGFGFWVCGSDASPPKQINVIQPVYQDTISNS